MTTFLAKAFRHGWYNEHQYVVYCGPDAEAAFALAEEELQERGGKYAIMVIEYGENGEDPISVDYYPSSRGEPSLQHNWHNEKRIHTHTLLEKFLTKEITEDQLRDNMAKINGLYLQLVEMEHNNNRAN